MPATTALSSQLSLSCSQSLDSYLRFIPFDVQMSRKQPIKDVFGKKCWEAQHRRTRAVACQAHNDSKMTSVYVLAEPRKVNAYLVPPQPKHSC